jgi:hypothetical protein
MAKRKEAGVTTRDIGRAYTELKNLHARLEPQLEAMTPAQKARLRKELNLKLKIVKVICSLLKLTAFRPFKAAKSARSAKRTKSAKKRP